MTGGGWDMPVMQRRHSVLPVTPPITQFVVDRMSALTHKLGLHIALCPLPLFEISYS